MAEHDNEMTEEQIAGMSDDDLLSMAIPPTLAKAEEPETQAGPDTAQESAGSEDGAADPEDDDASQGEADEAGEADGATEENGGEAGADDPDGNAADPHGDDAAGADAKDGSDAADKAKADAGEKPEGEKSGETSEKAEDKKAAEVDYKAEYEKIMAPFQANGKEIKLDSPEEAVKLMQMGANYTKKLQALQPNLRLVRMLENNNLLDEGKLSYLIDLDKKDPKAVQKLLKESGVDPLDIDTSAEPDYKPGNHRVSDEEMNFKTTLEDVGSNPAGKELISSINKTWDAPSKQALWSDPDILKVLSEQKQQGLFDQISAEVDRRKTLGYIGNAVPFIQAYKQVGEEMSAKGTLQTRESAKAPAAEDAAKASRVLETRPAKSKTPSNNERARAASPTKSGPSKVVKDFNPLAMSDEEFEKHTSMAGKV